MYRACKQVICARAACGVETLHHCCDPCGVKGCCTHGPVQTTAGRWVTLSAHAVSALRCFPVPQLQSIFLPLKLAHHHLSQFHCREALQALGALSERQRCSAGVLLLIGRCLYELVDYARAAEAFEAARTADPHNLEVRTSRAHLLQTVAGTWELVRSVHQLLYAQQLCL